MSENQTTSTKKQKKAQAFRANKGKRKRPEDLQSDVPQDENLEDAELETGKDDNLDPLASRQKKRRREESTTDEKNSVKGAASSVGPLNTAGANEGETLKKKRQRGKKKSQQVSNPDGKPKLVLFAGNLPYKISTEDIRKHFESTGETPIVRLLTPKSTGIGATTAKTKGFAFLEFTDAKSLQNALRLHESDLGGRKINVELTAGGGGNSASRKAKLSEKRKSLETERQKTAMNRKKREGKTEETPKDKSQRWNKPDSGTTAVVSAEPLENGTGQGPKTNIVVKVQPDGKVRKVRDRRIPKTSAGESTKEKEKKAAAKAAKAMSGSNTVPLGS